jgi:23S rRNA pseudouridine1911/1915/1917 synthase
MNFDPSKPAVLVTTHEDIGKRLDRYLAESCPGISRARLQLLIRNGMVRVDGKDSRGSLHLKAGQTIEARLEELENLRPAASIGEDIPLDILHIDDDIIIVNKPPAMVVHPAKGHWKGTLAAALIHHFGPLSTVGGPDRPGVVHRLDRDTSGVIVIARNDFAHTALMRQFESRQVEKLYTAVVSPPPDRDRDRIELPIGRHPYQREKMAVRDDPAQGKPAMTFYEVVKRAGRFALVNCHPKTGRTHQIRVHLAQIGSPVVADRLYSGRSRATDEWVRTGRDTGEPLIERQALHARSIAITHPRTGNRMEFTSPLPADIVRLWECVMTSFPG